MSRSFAALIRFFLLIAILCFSPAPRLTVAAAPGPQTSEPPDLFLPVGGNPIVPLAADTTVKRYQFVHLNTATLEPFETLPAEGVEYPRRLRLGLFPDAVFTAQIGGRQATSSGGYVLTGILEGSPDSEMTLSVQDGVVSANFSLPGGGQTPVRFYQVRPTSAAGLLAVREIEQASFPPEEDLVYEPPNHGAAPSSDPAASQAEDGSIIDVMVVYTAEARAAAGGTPAMQSLINLAVSETNTGYQRSLVDQRIHLVFSGEVNYSEAGFNWNTALNKLTGGDIPNVHTWRETYSADLTVLLVSSTYSSICGLSWVNTDMDAWWTADYGYSVVANSCATGYYSFAHEMGHAMGSVHDRATSGSSQGAFPYSYGYQDPGRLFRTIMAYNCPSGGCPRINNWSNPAVAYNGRATGVSASAPNSADNAQSLNHTAYFVSNFRTRPAPLAPGGVLATPLSGTQVSVSWVDNSFNETGFKIERSPAAANQWSVIGSAAENATQYTDQPLSCGSRYDYRVRATNSGGDSAPPALATAETPTCLPVSPNSLQSSQPLDDRVTLTWVDNNSSELGFKIYRKEGSGVFVPLGTVGTNVVAFTDTTLFCQKNYAYQVTAYNSSGESAPGNVVNVSGLACSIPPAPLVLAASSDAFDQIQVTWQDTPKETYFILERSLNGIDGWTQTGGQIPGNTTTYLDSGLAQETVYYYRVKAVSPAGASSYNNVISAETCWRRYYLPLIFK